MPVHLNALYVEIVKKLTVEFDKLSDDDFERESSSIRPAMYVLLLQAMTEKFMAFAFEKLIASEFITSKYPKDVLDELKKLTKRFHLSYNFPLLCSFFLPDLYVKSGVPSLFIEKRNAYAHNIVDEKGRYVFAGNDKFYLSKKQLEDFTEYFKQLMKKLAYEIDKICLDH